jgi:hypothetical protein
MAKKETQTIALTDPKLITNKANCPMSGSKNDNFGNILANQVVNALWLGSYDEESRSQFKHAALVGMMGVAPQDELEGMLAAQMVAAHNATMECFKRAMIVDQSIDSRDYNLNHAGKLMRAYAGMMEALGRYRGKGQQRIIVQHVNVENGGQAIVGNVNHPEGGGVQKKTEKQPHAKTITHAPEQAMPSQNKKRKAVPVPRDA